MCPKKAIKMINIQKITLKFKFQKCRNYAYIWKGEKKKKRLQF